jgi:hypothetical protein
MKKKIILTVFVLLSAVLLISAFYDVQNVLADSGYQINWWTIDPPGHHRPTRRRPRRGGRLHPARRFLGRGHPALARIHHPPTAGAEVTFSGPPVLKGLAVLTLAHHHPPE